MAQQRETQDARQAPNPVPAPEPPLMHIAAAVAREKGADLVLQTLEIESPRPDELLIRIVAAGVCHTDIAMRDQVFAVPMPVVLGHEGAGIVEQVGAAVTDFAPGDHVLMSFRACGDCASCGAKLPGYCHHFYDLNFAAQRRDGSTSLTCEGVAVHSHFFGQSCFAGYVVAHHSNVVKVAADAPLDILAPFGCGIQTGAGAILNALKVPAGAAVAVFGTGSVGLSAVMAAKIAGAAVIVAIDKNQSRLALARELGATHTVTAGADPVVERIREITGGGVGYAVDTTALPPVILQGVAALAPRGVMGLIGASRPDEELHLNIIDLLTQGKHVRGIIEGDAVPATFIPELIALHAAGKFPVEKMLTFYPFAEINQAIHDSEAGTTVKAVLRMG
jgi:aryl-alcohol dehydrogenase